MPTPPDSAADAAISTLTYEDAASELDRLVQTMESGRLSLEDSLQAFRRGALLLRHCQQLLDDADERLRVLEGDSLNPLVLDAGRST
jgi:exodeoxyribonuclease VII small subunit